MSPEILPPPLGSGTKGRKSCGPATAQCCHRKVNNTRMASVITRTKEMKRGQASHGEQGIESTGSRGTSQSGLSSCDPPTRERKSRCCAYPHNGTHLHAHQAHRAFRPRTTRGLTHAGSFTVALFIFLIPKRSSASRTPPPSIPIASINTERTRPLSLQTTPDVPIPLTNACGSDAHRGGKQSFPWRARCPPRRETPRQTRCQRPSHSPRRLPAR